MPRRARGDRREIGAERYRDLLEHLPVGVYRTTPDGRIVEANGALAAMLGVRRAADLHDLRVNEFYLAASDRSAHLRRLRRTHVAAGEFELRTRDGRTIWVRDFPRAVVDERGAVLYYDGILVDISERKQAEAALIRSERDYRNLFENAHDAILIFSLDREIILDANPRACELYGFRRDELLGRSLETLSKDVRRGKANIRRTRRQAILRNFETVHFRRDGSEMILEINAALVEYRGVPAILSIARDVSERRRMEETIRRQAFHDPLTGLPNRTLLADRLQLAITQARRRQRQLGLLFLDLDHFKRINDSYGHEAGDETLVAVAACLRECLRRSDTVARLGGDEFVVLLSEVKSVRSTVLTARKILAALRRVRLRRGRRRIAVSASIGIAVYPRDGENGETLLRTADRAMYRVKAAGRGDCGQDMDPPRTAPRRPRLPLARRGEI